MATLKFPAQVSVVEDAESLRKTVEGWGTNEKTVISILGHRNAEQRKQIRVAYHEIYQEDLIKRLESELSGDFERAVYRWILEPADRDAVLAHVAAVKEPKPEVIVEIATTRSPEELLAVRRAYQLRYKRSLEEDVAAHTTGDLRKLLVALVSAFRYNGGEIDARMATSESEALHRAIKDKDYNHEDVIRILSTRSMTQLMATFNRFRDDHTTSLTKVMQGDAGTEYQKALRTTIRCVSDHKKYFEKVLRHAIKRSGTDEDGLTRVIVTRAEKDLGEIKELYYKRNSVPLDQDIAKETSGDYKALLLTLLGARE